MEILSMQLRATLLILLIVLLRALFLYKWPKKVFMWLWALALARLLIPYTGGIVAGFSLPRLDNVLLSLFHQPAGTETGGQAENSFITYSLPWFLWAVWLIGGLLLAGYFIFGHIRGKRAFRFAYLAEAASVRQWRQGQRLRRNVRILQCPELKSALTYGVIRPVVLLPTSTDWEDRERLAMVLSHEWEHIRRFDVIWKWAAALTLCVSWYNPMVWVLYVLLARDVELRCDESVLEKQGINKQTKTEYALTLLALAEEKRGAFLLANHFSKSATEERVLSVMHGRYAPAVFVGIVIAGIVILAFLSFVTFYTGEAGIAFTMPID